MLTMPTLLFWAHPGAIINNEEQVKWFQQQMPALTVVDLGQGIHFMQEDHPNEIGKAVVQLLERT